MILADVNVLLQAVNRGAPQHAVAHGRPRKAVLFLLLGLCCVLPVHAEAPPLDPWTDVAWQDVMFGLPRGPVTRLHASQQLLDLRGGGGGGVMSTREVLLEFDAPDGRVSRAVINVARRGEASSRRGFRYVYADGRLQRIDEDGQATPAITRRYDAAGRPVQHTERTGAVVARTAWRHDGAGRVVERRFDGGTGSRTKETRRYRRDGTLERVQVDNGTLSGKQVDFDAQERPVRIAVTEVTDRHETTVTYPSPTEAHHATSGISLAREGLRRYAYTTSYRVRSPQELRGVEAPELPTMRRTVRDGRHDESQTDYDAAGRVLAERRLDAVGQVVCVSRITYHPSGPPVAARNERVRPDAPCEGVDFDNDVVADARGHWSEQRMWMLQPGGARGLMSIQTRRVDFRP